MNRNKLSALAIAAVCAARAVLAANPDTVLITNTAQNPGVVAVTGTANVAGSVSINNTPSVNVANSPLVQQAGYWTVDLNPGAQVIANLSPDASVHVSSLPPVPLAPNQSIGVSSLPAVSLAPNQSIAVTSLPQVTLSGTPSVNIANTPSVTIANQPGAGARYAEDPSNSPIASTPAPTGKRLIITQVSARAIVDTGRQAVVIVYVPATAGSYTYARLFVPLTPSGVKANATAVFVGTQQTELILDEGQFAYCEAELDGNGSGTLGLECSFFGRLIDAP